MSLCMSLVRDHAATEEPFKFSVAITHFLLQYNINGTCPLKLSYTKWMALLCTREVPWNCSIQTHTPPHWHTKSFNWFGFFFFAPLLLPIASLSIFWFQLFPFTSTIPNLKKPFSALPPEYFSPTLNNTLYHTLQHLHSTLTCPFSLSIHHPTSFTAHFLPVPT